MLRSLLLLVLPLKMFAQDPASHDPSTIINDAGKYYFFSTGHGITVQTSTDLKNWQQAESVFKKGSWPEWVNTSVPGFKGHFWAPDVLKMNGKYYLYYSCSTFGSSTSAIGLATNVTLDQKSPDYQWQDEGMVIESKDRKGFNAIDPSLLQDTDGRVYLTYGSFFGGIGTVELDASTGKIKDGASVTRVAGGNASDWEAACLTKEGNYYYLFVNNGQCCKGVNSTYYIVVGRSEHPLGPFLDAEGKDLTKGGGTLVLRTSGRYIGPGHVGLLKEKKQVSIHYYDAEDNGKSKQKRLSLSYKKGWPILTENK
ncbi:arabinan endo-1,5-alpha-L-arabinosidase [Siphonobacter sp. SORGH_AS_0500]|uniref:arabinan endo-1,5-alpha-L-arabinosidase n=1 Tax=Siphonobacter sp. SORGH_AS_0500 TaxID=1864824 RepID=UPI0028587E6B|nr:arabinan endo-1,5-alpha-L-arabinosidase [Siphonobacter sp. SORGH_AS_0500]MDR6194048.1 arabinan endo-1,5-alpha-L-arabinosidase [Siphonobacter sp. SORGH_AS_0500]